MIGLGIKVNSTGGLERTLVSLDPVSKAFATLGTVSGYLIESGGESALDAQRGILYWIGQKEGAAPADPFYLIGLNATTAAVVSAAPLCPDDASCPWTIEVQPSA